MGRIVSVERKTAETNIKLRLDLDGSGKSEITTGIPFFDHMLTLFSAHGFFDLSVEAHGDVEVDFHHTVEDVGLVLGDALLQALGKKMGIVRYGHAITPMDETLSSVTVDLSGRPFLAYNIPEKIYAQGAFDVYLAKEFFRAFSNKASMNLHINVHYGENEHHIIESIFKSLGRALDMAVSFDDRIKTIRTTKGSF